MMATGTFEFPDDQKIASFTDKYQKIRTKTKRVPENSIQIGETDQSPEDKVAKTVRVLGGMQITK